VLAVKGALRRFAPLPACAPFWLPCNRDGRLQAGTRHDPSGEKGKAGFLRRRRTGLIKNNCQFYVKGIDRSLHIRTGTVVRVEPRAASD
jgi:hypothetical protein